MLLVLREALLDVHMIPATTVQLYISVSPAVLMYFYIIITSRLGLPIFGNEIQEASRGWGINEFRAYKASQNACG